MDGTTAATQGPFVTWVLANGQIVLFFAQIIFWLAVGFAALWAACTFNRMLKFMRGGYAPVADKAADEAVSVEEFVE